MITFFKRKYGLLFGLVFLWGFQFVFFPSHHYHLENIHAHSGELSPRHHQGHAHSHEVQAFRHLINNHTPEPLQGEDHHRANPFGEDHSDDYEINLHKSSLKPESPFKTVKNGDVQNRFIVAEPILFSYFFPNDLLTESFGPPDRPKERSPPSFLI